MSIRPEVMGGGGGLVSPVGIERHRALDDDDLPRVEPSGDGPCVGDHLRSTADMWTPALTQTQMTELHLNASRVCSLPPCSLFNTGASSTKHTHIHVHTYIPTGGSIDQ